MKKKSKFFIVIKKNKFNQKSVFLREEEIKIDWDISLIFTTICELKFDGKIRAMEMFMDTNLTCKVNKTISLSFSFRMKPYLFRL